MTAIFAPAPPTPAQLDASFWLGVRVAGGLYPVHDFDAELAEVAEARLRYPASGMLARYLDGVEECLNAMRQVQRAEVAA